MQNSNLKAFTLVELIVVITILAILGTIAFISLQGYSNSAKNSVVISDIKLLNSDLELYFQKAGRYPEPDGPIVDVINLLKQGFIGDGVMRNLGDINKKPLNPFTNEEYKYSKTTYGNEYELASYIYEGLLSDNVINNVNAINESQLKYYIKGNFNGLMAYNRGLADSSVYNILSLPSLIINIENDTGTGITITYWDLEKKLVANGFNKTDYIDFIPVNLGGLPENYLDVQKVLENLTYSFSGTTSSELPQIRNFLEEKDSKTFLNIGKTFVNKKIGLNINEFENIEKRNCNYIGGLFEKSYNNSDWGDCVREYCYNGFIETGTGCLWSGTFLLDANDENTYKYETIYKNRLTDNGGTKTFITKTVDDWIMGNTKIPIDTVKTYKLSGTVKAISGTGVVYVGLRGFDKSFRGIDARYVFRYGNEGTILSIDNSKIQTDTLLSGWYGSGSRVYQRTLGFYLDGDTTKLPDYLYKSQDASNGNNASTINNYGPFSITSGNDILLNYSIPKYITDKIIPGVTKVKNHSDGSTRNYSFAQTIGPANGTINFSINITGENYGAGSIKFRTGTKYADLFIGKGSGYQVEFNNLKLEELP